LDGQAAWRVFTRKSSRRGACRKGANSSNWNVDACQARHTFIFLTARGEEKQWPRGEFQAGIFPFRQKNTFPNAALGWPLRPVPPLRSRTAQNWKARSVKCPKLPTPRGLLWAIGGSGLGMEVTPAALPTN
jgi:hypothetical protein